MSEPDNKQLTDRKLRRLEQELDYFLERLAANDIDLLDEEDSWSRYVEYPIEQLASSFPSMSEEQKELYQHCITQLKEMRPALEENEFEFPTFVDRLTFVDGEMILAPPPLPAMKDGKPQESIFPTFDPQYNASLLQCLGFAFQNDYEYLEFMRKAANKGDPTPTKNGSFVTWSFGNGIEIWSMKDGRHRVIAMRQHFAGNLYQYISINGAIPSSESPLVGYYCGWVNPDVDRDDEEISIDGDYPVVFDCTAFDYYRELPFPVIARVQLTAFAIQFGIVDPAKERPTISEPPVRLGDEFYIPTGTLHPDTEEKYTPIAMFGGTVTSCRVLYNMVSKQNFTHATIRTYGMEIDTVIAQHSLERTLKEGDLVQGRFLITGNIIEIIETFTKKDPVYRGRLFGQIPVAGVEYQDAEDRIEQLGFGEPVILKREPDNAHDHRAIAVMTLDNIKLGYVPRSQNYALAKILDAGKVLTAQVAQKYSDPRVGVDIRIYFPDDEPKKEKKRKSK